MEKTFWQGRGQGAGRRGAGGGSWRAVVAARLFTGHDRMQDPYQFLTSYLYLACKTIDM